MHRTITYDMNWTQITFSTDMRTGISLQTLPLVAGECSVAHITDVVFAPW